MAAASGQLRRGGGIDVGGGEDKAAVA